MTRSSSSDGTSNRADGQIHSEAGKQSRLARHFHRITADLREWVELRIELTSAEVEEKVEQRIRETMEPLVWRMVAAVAGFFGLMGVGFAVGEWLGHPAWGFFIVAAFLTVLAIAIRFQRNKTSESQPLPTAPGSDPNRTEKSSETPETSIK